MYLTYVCVYASVCEVIYLLFGLVVTPQAVQICCCPLTLVAHDLCTTATTTTATTFIVFITTIEI